ncbi:hypothetical protein [Microbacterium esteraromaticum]|uniref:hypothetical protein n=1 Tax=Microbacterium esteraromaticum TaxID=57043 RepID=UPI001C96E868|nr:hypothetical protein [Microbacterium esteraromaticum]MBY6061608.1 hypothetical protein [Microbacterium esteraromaticum]
MFNPDLIFAAAPPARAAAPRRPKVTRRDFTAKLGLPDNATNEQVFAAVDALNARKTAAALTSSTHRAQPTGNAADSLTARDDALYALAWGA